MLIVDTLCRVCTWSSPYYLLALSLTVITALALFALILVCAYQLCNAINGFANLHDRSGPPAG